MSGDGRMGPRPVTDPRTDSEVGPVLETWMEAVAPLRAPDRLLEESFARTMVAGQLRAYPWRAVGGRRGEPGSRRIVGLGLAGTVAVLAVALTFGLISRPTQSISGTPSPTPIASASPSPFPFPSAVIVEPTASIPVSGVIDMATDGTRIWVLTDDSRLMRIDPRTDSIVATVALAPAAYQSVAGDANGLWVTNWDAGTLLRFDPVTLRSIASIPVSSDISSSPKGLLVSGGVVWVADTHRGSVARFDPSTNRLVATTVVGPAGPSGPNWLAAGGGSIWTGVPNIGAIARINATTNVLEATIPVGGPDASCGGLATIATAVWATSCGGGNVVTQIDPATNTIAATVDLGGDGYGFGLVGERLWVSPAKGQLARLDPINHVADRVIAPGPAFASGGTGILEAAGSVWIDDWTANRLLRLPLAAFGG